MPTRDYQKTNMPSFFVAGDASRWVQFAVAAAMEGAKAAFAADRESLPEICSETNTRDHVRRLTAAISAECKTENQLNNRS